MIILVNKNVVFLKHKQLFPIALGRYPVHSWMGLFDPGQRMYKYFAAREIICCLFEQR